MHVKIRNKKHKLQAISYKLQASSGFTLIEIAVVTAIIALLAGIVLFNQKDGRSNLAMDRSAQIITQAVNQAVNYSLGGKLYDGVISSAGYGIYLTQNTSTVTIFADCNNNAVYNASGNAPACDRTTPGNAYPETVEVKNLEQNITISSFDVCTGAATLLIVFRPPDPRTVFSPSLDVGCTEAGIIIADTQGNTRTIYINQLGIARVE